eukprot:3419448-Rhodomonas_salina.1
MQPRSDLARTSLICSSPGAELLLGALRAPLAVRGAEGQESVCSEDAVLLLLAQRLAQRLATHPLFLARAFSLALQLRAPRLVPAFGHVST